MNNDEQNAKFAAPVTRYLADAHTFARWLTRSRTDADDVLQESCIRALAAIEQYSGERSRAWVPVIADIAQWSRHVSKVPMLLKKSSLAHERNFSAPLVRPTLGDVKDHIDLRKSDQ